MSLPAPMNPSLSASAHHVATLPESAWLHYRNVLQDLYIYQHKTLNDVKRTMEEEHGFPVMRPHDYEVALREVLGLRKNLRGQDWQAIKAHWDWRQNNGKKSTVLWNGMIVDEKKVRKEIHRKRTRSHLSSSRLGSTALPPDVIIKTPPPSPTASIMTVVGPIEPRPDSESMIPSASERLEWVRYGSPARFTGGIAFLEPAPVAVSGFHELRKECPFNLFIGNLLDFSDSYHILDMVPVECAQTPTPRLLGMNPSWELLARVTFKISNKMSIDWTAHESSWLLNWFGVSADLRVLRAFFSITGPTVCAVYENLCGIVHYFRRPAAANVLFAILDTVRGNNPIVADALNFLEIAVRIGSTSNGMVDMAGWAVERHAQVLDDAARHERLWLSTLIAASRRDTPMLRLLVDAGARPDFAAEFDVESPYYEEECQLVLQVSYQLLSWSPGEEHAINDFIQLLIKGGLLSTKLPSCWCNTYQLPVNVSSGPIEFDEAIMLCPSIKRQAIYKAIIRHSGESQTFVRHAGVFAAAAGGRCSLEAYIQSCRQDDDFDFLATMQECLAFAALLNDTETMFCLLQMGTDPSIPLLQNNEETYKKGKLPWNPMVIAAGAGSKEALVLLKEWSKRRSFRAFLERVPFHEIVRQANLNTDESICGTKLLRLQNLHRKFSYLSSVNGELEAKIAIKIEGSRASRLELLTWIRSNAVAHNARTKLDEEILESAVFKAPELTQSRYHVRTQNHYCDVLLLDGLVDSNLEYQESGMDLLQLSIRNQCSLEVVEFLLSKGFKVHSRRATEAGTQNTMLLDALLSRSPDRCQIVRLLLQQGADSDCKQTTTGLTLLEASLLHSSNGREAQTDLETFQCLLDKGAPIPQRPRRLIKLLIQAGAADKLILYVLDAIGCAKMQASSSQRADFTWLPLVQAIFHNRETLARELIRRGADVHVPANYRRESTALQAACSSGSSLDFIKYLILENGVNVNEAPAENKETALQRCTSLSVSEFLLTHGADVNALSGSFDCRLDRYKFRRRALDLAAEYGRLDMLEFLLKARGRSGYGGLRGAILLAKQYRHLAVLSVLLDWERKHSNQIVEEEAKWQLEHPDAAFLLSKAA